MRGLFKNRLWLSITLVLCTFTSSVAFAGNMETCILDTAPGLQSDMAAYAAYQVCLKRYPEGIKAVPQGDGRGWFSFDSGADCVLKKAADTRSRVAAGLITAACHRLYDEPPIPWEDFVPAPK